MRHFFTICILTLSISALALEAKSQSKDTTRTERTSFRALLKQDSAIFYAVMADTTLTLEQKIDTLDARLAVKVPSNKDIKDRMLEYNKEKRLRRSLLLVVVASVAGWILARYLKKRYTTRRNRRKKQ